MKIQDFLNKRSVVANLTSASKKDVLQELASAIAEADQVDRSEVLKVLSARERLGSTGIGDGVAIPHGTMTSLSHLVALFGRSPEGVEFDAIDGRPTNIFFVLLTPDNNVGLQALARVSRLLRRASFREKLIKAPDQDSLFDAIAQEDDRL